MAETILSTDATQAAQVMPSTSNLSNSSLIINPQRQFSQPIEFISVLSNVIQPQPHIHIQPIESQPLPPSARTYSRFILQPHLHTVAVMRAMYCALL